MGFGSYIKKKFPNFILVLAFTELWERYSYFAMGGILTLFMTDYYGYPDEYAYAVYSLYLAFANYLPVVTGTLADRYFGFVNMLFIGGVINAIGHVMMFIAQYSDILFYWSIAAVSVGTGFFRGNILNLLGACYDSDKRLDRVSGFTLFYAAVNIGAFSAAVTSGYGSEYVSYHFAFGLAGIGMFIGLFVFFFYRGLYRDKNPIRNPKILSKKYFGISMPYILFIIAFIIVFPIAVFIYYSDIWSKNNIVFYITIPIILYIIYIFIWKAKNTRERKNLFIVIIYLIAFMIFYAYAIQLATVFPLFVDRNIHKFIGPIPVPAIVSVGINPLMIIIIGLLTSVIFKHNPKYDLIRVGYGILSNSFAFFILYWGAHSTNPKNAQASYVFPVIGILPMAIGEVLMAPLIQAAITTYSPDGLKGTMMGLYMCFMGFSSLSGFLFADILSVPNEPDGSIDPFKSLEVYRSGFLQVAWINLIFFALFVLSVPLILYLKRPTKAEQMKADLQNKQVTIMTPD